MTISTIGTPCRILLVLFFLALLTPQSAIAQKSDNTLPGLSLVWSKNVGGIRSLYMSPKARWLALLTTEGKLALWSAHDGTPLWSKSNVTYTNVQVSDGAGAVLTFNKCSLLDRSAQLRSANNGSTLWSTTFGSAVWSASFSLDGSYLAIGTGDRFVHEIDLASSESQANFPVNGIPASLAFTDDGSGIIVGQWDRSGVSCLDLTGKTMWNASGANNRRYSIAYVGQRYITYTGSSNRHGVSPTVYVVRSSTGALLWAYNLDATDSGATAESTDTANITALSFSKCGAGPGAAPEQRLACIDRSGQLTWQKGGLFWAPTLICLTPDQSGLVVYDGNRTIYRLDSQGRTVSHAFLSDQLRQWSVSEDRTSIVVYTHDGQLSLLHSQ